jgi:uncharacterized membrane protein YedE/YeeE
MITTFEPGAAALGGLLIGLSAVLLMWLNGRIAGISGIMAGCLPAGGSDRGWRLAFMAGLIGAPLVGLLFGIGRIEPAMPENWVIVIAAGLLVGFGTRMAGGCTSGHGVCGIARLSPRSVVATVTFMVAAAVVVFIARHAGG